MKDSLIIVSGGMDSITLLYEYADQIALGISFDYGANHNKNEIPFAKLHCERLGIKHLVIPLDVHVYRQATELGLTKRRAKDIVTARDITDSFREIFPDDPAKGDFALFGYGVSSNA